MIFESVGKYLFYKTSDTVTEGVCLLCVFKVASLRTMLLQTPVLLESEPLNSRTFGQI